MMDQQAQSNQQDKHISIFRDVYQIKINNALFFNMLGKYTSVMTMFSHIGFTKVDRPITTAFTYLHDPDTEDGADKMKAWLDTSESDISTPSALLAKSSKLAQEFNTNKYGRPMDKDKAYYEARQQQDGRTLSSSL